MGELRFEEIARKVMAGEMSQQQGADALGMLRGTFKYRLDKAYPDRPKGVNVRKENRRKGSGRPHTALTYLESAYTDSTLCDDLSCSRCPMNRGGKCQGPEGLIKALLSRVPAKPLKDEEKPLEDSQSGVGKVKE